MKDKVVFALEANKCWNWLHITENNIITKVFDLCWNLHIVKCLTIFRGLYEPVFIKTRFFILTKLCKTLALFKVNFAWIKSVLTHNYMQFYNM